MSWQFLENKFLTGKRRRQDRYSYSIHFNPVNLQNALMCAERQLILISSLNSHKLYDCKYEFQDLKQVIRYLLRSSKNSTIEHYDQTFSR